MNRPLLRSVSSAVVAALLLSSQPGLLHAQAVLVQRGVPVAPAGLAPVGGAAAVRLAGPQASLTGLAGPSLAGSLPSIHAPSVRAAAAGAAALAAPAGVSAAARAAALSVSVETPAAFSALRPEAVMEPAATASSPSSIRPVLKEAVKTRGTDLRSGLAGFTGRLSRAAVSVQLSRLFDGSRQRGLDETTAPARRNAVAAQRGGLTRENAAPAVQEQPGVPAPAAPAAKKTFWKRALAFSALGLSLAGGAYLFGPQLLAFAESFGADMDLSAGLSIGSFAVAFAGGLLSFLAPCTLPLIPAYLTFISGASLEDLKAGREASWRHAVLGALAFVAGFSTVFTLLGATATALGALLVQHMPVIAKGAGIVVAVMGLHMAGIWEIGLLYRQKRADMGAVKSKFPLLKAFLMGLAFAAGWTPCIGPILAGILSMAAMGETVASGMALLMTYSMGLGVPFVLSALMVNRFLKFSGKYKKYFGVGERLTGAMLVLVGLLIFFGGIQQVAGFFG